MPKGGTKTLKASTKAKPAKHVKVVHDPKSLAELRTGYVNYLRGCSTLKERYEQAVDERAVLAEEAGEEDPEAPSTHATADFGVVDGVNVGQVVFPRNTPLPVEDSNEDDYSKVGAYMGVGQNEHGHLDFKNAADAEADAVGSGHAQLENHTARGILTCGKRMLKTYICAQCRREPACFTQTPAQFVAVAEVIARERGEDVAQAKQDDLDTFCHLATSGKEEDEAILTQIRCVCNEPKCLLSAGIKDVDQLVAWHKGGEHPNLKGRNVRHDVQEDLLQGLYLARERFVETPETASADEQRAVKAQVKAIAVETLDGSYKLRSWEVMAATTAATFVAHQQLIGIAIPDASDFIARMQSAPRVLVHELALAHVTSTDWNAAGHSVVKGGPSGSRKNWRSYLETIILDPSIGFPNAWVLARVYFTIRNYEANNCPKDGAGKPVHRVRKSQMCDYWLDQAKQHALLAPFFDEKAFKQVIAYLSSASSAEQNNGANKTNAYADAKKAMPMLKHHEIMQVMRAQIETAKEDKAMASLTFKTSPSCVTHDHNSKNGDALYVHRQVAGAVLALGLLNVVGGEEGAIALLLTPGGKKAPGCGYAYHFSPPEVVDELDIIHPDAANPMPALAPGAAGMQLSQGSTAARKRSVGALQTKRKEPVTLNAVPRMDFHNSGATKVCARERPGDCPKAALSLVQKSIPLDPDTKKALLVTSATPAADNPGRTWTSKLRMGMKDVSEEDKMEYRAILDAQHDLAAFKENGTKPSQLAEADLAQKLASAHVLVDALDKADRLPYLKKSLAGLPPILANHPKELEPALRKLAAFHTKKASPRRKSPVPANLGVAPAQGVQKPAHRSKPVDGQAQLDREAARHNTAEANAESKLKRLRAKAKKNNAASGLSRMVRGMSLCALPKGSNRKDAEAKKLKELQDNAAAAEAEDEAAAAQKAEAEAVARDKEFSHFDIFGVEEDEEEGDANQPEWAAEALDRAQPEE